MLDKCTDAEDPLTTSRNPALAEAAFRPTLAAALLGAMLLLVVLGEFAGFVPEWLPGAVAGLAMALLWPRVPGAVRAQAGALAAIGGIAFVVGDPAAADLSASALLGYNDALLAMLVAVRFLRLLPTSTTDAGDPPRGRGAFLRTALAINVQGALINIPGMIIVGDRLARGRPLPRREALLLCRSFSSAVLYSPFIGGMALALHYAPGSSILAVMSLGAALALAGIALGYAGERRRDAGGLSRFEGYPLRYRNLAFPALLAAAVMGWHLADPTFPVLVLIAGLAPAMALAVLAGTRGPLSGLRAMAAHGRVELPGMAGEVALFLAAGVLAVGLTSALATHGVPWMPLRFDAGTASGLVLVVYALSSVGVHPVVPLTIAATLLAPLDPDPTLMVMSFVMGWGIGCAGNPLSGQVLILQARYSVAGWRFSRWNARWCLALAAAGAGLLHAWEWLYLSPA